MKIDEHQVRLTKYKNWQETNAIYPNTIKNRVMTDMCLIDSQETYCIAGRIMLMRDMGKTCFVTIEDASGKLQLYARKDLLENYEQFITLDLGDIIEAHGQVFVTKSGEKTLRLSFFRLLSKSLMPFPDKFHGVNDRELCYRQRYLDLMVNPSTKERFLKRVAIIDSIRAFLKDHSFLEVETPMLHTLAGGALAKPFITHHNALGMELFLRIAPELHLKRLLVGGFERVFEINRNFRNEGLSTRHNPEFTMLEFYQAYATCDDMINFTQALLKDIVAKVSGSLMVNYQGHTIDFSLGFRVITMLDAVREVHPDLDLMNIEAVRSWLLKHQFDYSGDSLDKLHLELFEKTVEHTLIQPTFITAYPTSISPLARRNDDNPDIVDRFELFIAGYEVANAFSELNDPIDQANRFEQQMLAKSEGAEETMPYDDDYIQALSYAMPPAAGEGIGIDRLTMILTNAGSIKDVILFPHMRPIHN